MSKQFKDYWKKLSKTEVTDELREQLKAAVLVGYAMAMKGESQKDILNHMVEIGIPAEAAFIIAQDAIISYAKKTEDFTCIDCGHKWSQGDYPPEDAESNEGESCPACGSTNIN